ncbi:MAG TPA: hypothetical protein VK638_38855 [Edaphobacter sp.]|nr:hypothetical protein [Edaphobacter sp.]
MVTYEFKEERGAVTVRLRGDIIGHLQTVSGYWQYWLKGSKIGSKLFPTLEACQKSLKEQAEPPMADERETAQWYIVNSQMKEIQAIVADRRGRGWSTLPQDVRDALRAELHRIRSIGEEIDRAAGRDPQTGETSQETAERLASTAARRELHERLTSDYDRNSGLNDDEEC